MDDEDGDDDDNDDDDDGDNDDDDEENDDNDDDDDDEYDDDDIKLWFYDDDDDDAGGDDDDDDDDDDDNYIHIYSVRNIVSWWTRTGRRTRMLHAALLRQAGNNQSLDTKHFFPVKKKKNQQTFSLLTSVTIKGRSDWAFTSRFMCP